jgi:hypothetical protein
MSTQSALNAILLSGDIPADLEITYDDRHGLWGGTLIVVGGRGVARERRERTGNDPAPEVFEAEASRDQLLELIALLVELEAWEQRTEDRPPLPDESRAALSVSVGGQSSLVWERFNDMASNRRLIRVKTLMSEIVRGEQARRTNRDERS